MIFFFVFVTFPFVYLFSLFSLFLSLAWHVTSQEFTIDNINDFKCGWVDNNRTCPDLFNEIRFYLYTRLNVNESQLIHIDSTLSASNLTRSNFNARHSSKIIIHGFRSDMFLTPLYEMKNGNFFMKFSHGC